MSFQFSATEIEFTYKGEEYTLPINVRLALDLEKAIGMHPLVLVQRIESSMSKGEVPPIGMMAEFFEFVLKRAGARGVKLDDVYFELFDGTDAAEVGAAVGNLLSVFVPQQEQKDPKLKASGKAAK